MKTLFWKLYIVFIASILLFSASLIVLSYYQEKQISTLISRPIITNEIKALFNALPQPLSFITLERIADNFHSASNKDVCLLDESNALLNCPQLKQSLLSIIDRFKTNSRFQNDQFTIIGPFNVETDRGLIKLLFVKERPKITKFQLLKQVRRHTNLMIILISALVCIIPWLIISHRFSTPLSRLTRVIEAMKKESFEYPISTQDLQRNDGIGELARVLERVQHAMQQTQTANKDLVSRISHELHTPLTRIALATGLIAKKAPQAELTPQLESIEKDCQQIVSLSDELMDLSRLASGRINEFKEPISINSLVEDVLSEFHGLYQQRQLMIKQHWHSPIRIQGYRKELRLMLKNLFDNIYKYADTQSLIHINAYIRHDAMIIELSNNSKLELPKADVFEPFVHSGNQSNGHGLGLSFVKQIMELHNGHAQATHVRGIFTMVLSFQAE